MNIYQRINEVRKAIGYVQKDKSVSTGGGSYRAVSHDAVIGMVRAALIEHGVIIVPDLVVGIFHPREDGAKQRLYEASYQISFVNAETPEECIHMQVSAHALDNGDKAPGKAMSYATKYAILKLFNIETGEDDESRYQQDDFDVDYQVLLIKASDNAEGLKQQWGASMALTKDKDAHRQLIAAKDSRKAELVKIAQEKVTT